MPSYRAGFRSAPTILTRSDFTRIDFANRAAQRFSMNPADVIAWLNEEGMVELAPDFPADGDLFAAGLDSMAVMQLVVAAEEKFGVILGPEDITREHLSTPEAMARLFTEKSS